MFVMVNTVFAVGGVAVSVNSDRAFHMLENLDISPFEVYTGNYTLTRAEFAVLLMEYVVPDDTTIPATLDQIIFLDVSPSDWFARHVTFAVTQGYIAGHPDGSFRPHDNITLAEAMTIAVEVLGHRLNAQSWGGFPAGYMAAASRAGLLINISGTLNYTVTQSAAAQLFYNMLDAQMMEARVFGETVTLVPTVTFGDRTFRLARSTGVLQAFGVRRISGNIATSADSVVIGGVVYNKRGNDLEAILGAEINFYYRINDGSNNDFVFGEISDRVMILEVDRRSFAGYENRVLSHRNAAGRVVGATISGSAYIMFNGAPLVGDQFSTGLYNDMVQGRFILIDNNRDGVFDVVRIISEVNYIVSTVDDEENYITDRYGLPLLFLDVNSGSYTARIMDAQGNTMALDRIAPLDVVTVIRSLEGDFVDAFVSKSSVTGIISELDVGDYVTTVTINGEEFVFSPLLRQALAEGAHAGLNARFLLDMHGEIAYFDTYGVLDGLRFGYIIAFDTRGSVLEPTLLVRIFDQDGRFNTFTVNNRSMIDGMTPTFSLAEDFVDNRNNPTRPARALTEQLWGNGFDFRHQLVRFRLNTDGEVIEIDTVVPNVDENVGNQLRLLHVRGYEDALSTDFPRRNIKQPVAGEMLLANVGMFTLSGLVSFTPSTLVFTIPHDPINAAESGFHVGIPTSQFNSAATLANGTWYHFDAFRVNTETLSAEVLVKYANNVEAMVNSDSRIAVVDTMTQMFNDDGEPVTRLRLLGEGVPVNTFVPANISLTNVRVPAVRIPNPANDQVGLAQTALVFGATATFPVEPGDIVRVALNYRNEVVDIEILFKYSLNEMVPQNPITQNIVTQNVMLDGEMHAADAHHLFGSMIRPLPLRHRFIAFQATVAERDGRTLRLVDQGEGVGGLYTLHPTITRIFVYDSRLQGPSRVRPGSVGDIRDARSYGVGSTVVLGIANGTIRTVIVYQ